MRKLTSDEYIKKANIRHNYRYTYDNLIYLSSNKKVKIICNIHGEFEQEANSHLRGVGCSMCSGNNKSDYLEFIKKSIKIHGDKYDYSKVEYINAKTKVKIICKIHGEFVQIPNNHLNNHGCYSCGCENANLKKRKKLEKFIEDSISVHGDKYDYSKVEYLNAKTKVKIICKIHGEFEQTPKVHLKSICGKCSANNNSKRLLKKQEDFINECKIIHGDKYDYSLVNYTGTDDKVDIICKKHGKFSQKCYKHLQNQGCPICSESKLEKEIRLLLIKNNINFKQQYGGRTDDFYLNGQKLDFYLPDYKIAIECQGQQHFSPVDFGNKGLDYSIKQHEKIKQYDQNKYNYCKYMSIKMLYYCNKVNYIDNYIDDLFHESDEIIYKINNI